MTDISDRVFEFDGIRVEPVKFKIWRDEAELVLEPKTLSVLIYLLENRGRLIEKDELLNAIWHNTFVTENAMAREIAKLRKALGDDAKESRYIQTVHTKGYRFVAEVSECGSNGHGELTPVYIQTDLSGRPTSAVLGREQGDSLPKAYRTGGYSFRRLILLFALVVTALGTTVFLATRYVNNRSPHRVESIAVLPFSAENITPDQEYITDGISDELINSLAAVREIRVVSRSTSSRYKDRDIDSAAIGRELRVQVVLTGKVRQVGDTLNVQVDLVDSVTGAQLWGAAFVRQAADALTVKQAIIRDLTDKLKFKLSGAEQRDLVRRDAKDPETYELYLRGRFFSQRGSGGKQQAVAIFQQAIDRDPNYAPAYVGLANDYIWLGGYGLVATNEALPKAIFAVERAIQLDDTLSEAHRARAELYDKQWRWQEKEKEMRLALELDANNPQVYLDLANHLFYYRKFGEAILHLKKIKELDPLFDPSMLATAYLYNKDRQAAIREALDSVKLRPDHTLPHSVLGWAYFKEQRFDEATTELETAAKVSNGLSPMLRDLAYCYASTGKRDEAISLLRELEKRLEVGSATGSQLAGVHFALGDKDTAFAYLEKDFSQRAGGLQNITYLEVFDDIRNDPRYSDLIRRIGLESD